jgi:hypothetical protein
VLRCCALSCYRLDLDKVVLMVHFATEPLSMLMAAACGGSTELERAVDEVGPAAA